MDNDSKTGMCVEDMIAFFIVRRIFGQFELIRQSGIRVTRIMTTLLVMLFYRSRNIHSYFSWQYVQQIDKEGRKNHLFQFPDRGNHPGHDAVHYVASIQAEALQAKASAVSLIC
jgi:hypothetical protein